MVTYGMTLKVALRFSQEVYDIVGCRVSTYISLMQTLACLAWYLLCLLLLIKKQRERECEE